ncbi:hypothetical protein FXO38_06859 [Capsicum annuum]|nr:hypothetical protein FXO38_06859 [Capsicum annuum]
MLVLWTKGDDGKDRMHVGQVKLDRMFKLLALMGLEVVKASTKSVVWQDSRVSSTKWIFSGSRRLRRRNLSNKTKFSSPLPLGELKHFLSLEVDRTKEGLFLCQQKYAKDFIQKYGM